jgi:RND superfamily putative drug exporter
MELMMPASPATPSSAPPVPRDTLLPRIGRACFRHRWWVVAVWFVALLGLGVTVSTVGTGYTESFGDFESEGTRGLDLLEAGFGGSAGGDQGTIVFVSEGGFDDPAVRDAITTFLDEVGQIDGLDAASPFAEGGERQIASAGPLAGTLAYADVNFPPDADADLIRERADEVKEIAPELDGLRIEYGGEVFAEEHPPETEIIGVGFAIIILILAFGSVLAMGLPIGMALAGIGTGVAVIGLVSNVLVMPDLTTIIAVMIGLGVGIDYALFIVTRYREDVHRGMGAEDAATHAIDTAGRAVLFAGITVVISLLGMVVMGLGFIRGMGIGAAIAVLFTLPASITLLPALIALAGDRLERSRWRGIVASGIVALSLIGVGLKVDAAVIGFPIAIVVIAVGGFLPWLKEPLPPRKVVPLRETRWYRWSRVIQHHPWRSAMAGFVVLAVLAIPVFSLRLGFSDTGNFEESTTTRQAYDLLAEGFGDGFNGPLLLAGDIPAGTDPAVLDGITQALGETDGVAVATPPTLSPDGAVARWIVVPRTSPQDEATFSLVNRLRDDVLPVAVGESGVEVLVSCNTALGVDFSAFLSGRYPLFFGAVLSLSFLLLMAVFRSLLVPLKAVVMNLLSIGAAYGVVVAMFQWGWGRELVGVGKGGPIEPFVPMMLFAIVFGLSMDYEVFLLSRMKEEYDRTKDNATAVADGLAATARVITAAAAIMVVVFGSFLLEDDRLVKLFGIGLSVAVLLDATVVRMLLVPATMELLGDRNWWIPRWLDRILPTIHVEGRAEPSTAPEEPVPVT